MAAKDTVMNETSIQVWCLEFMQPGTIDLNYTLPEKLKEFASAQAELTWPDAFEAGVEAAYHRIERTLLINPFIRSDIRWSGYERALENRRRASRIRPDDILAVESEEDDWICSDCRFRVTLSITGEVYTSQVCNCLDKYPSKEYSPEGGVYISCSPSFRECRHKITR